jgi:hypothetical protein
MKTVKRPLGESLSDLAEILAATHETYFRENPGGTLNPHIMMVGQNGVAEILPLPLYSANHRAVVLAMIRKVLSLSDFVRYAIWGEAWYVRGEAAKRQMQAESPRLNDSPDNPDRRECVFTICVDRDGAKPISINHEIIRGEGGGVVRLERDPLAHEVTDGGFANLFPPHQIHA